MSFAASDREIDLVRSSQANGRRHDITMAIIGAEGVIVIAKPWYPPGIFRIPSGGLLPGETLEAGAAREALEETGTRIELARYYLRIDVDFVGREVTIPWTSHVFSAHYRGGEVKPQDTDEISDARWCMLDALAAHHERMRRSSVSGFHYRAALEEELLHALPGRT
jgi:8-oxo-dGTP pyrophosphatase MutT (NUDIX family)